MALGDKAYMDSESYTKEVNKLAHMARNALEELSGLMKDHGDEVRAMDVDEAKEYLEGALESIVPYHES